MKKLLTCASLIITIFLTFQPALAVSPQETKSTLWQKLSGAANQSGYVTGTQEAPLPKVIGNVINLFLGVLGTVAVILLLYAGYLWMLSGGNEDQVSKAKAIIKQVVVGLIVLSLAYAIVTFVVSLVSDATVKK